MSDKIAAAKRRFRAFLGRAPKKGDIGILQQDQETIFILGRCTGICYAVQRNGKREDYIHNFGERDGRSSRAPRKLPLLAVSSDGKRFFVLAGNYTFTDRGFVG